MHQVQAMLFGLQIRRCEDKLMANVILTIDGIKVTCPRNMTVLQAALSKGIYIPNLCHFEDLKPAGVCRMCLVRIGGRLVTACTTPVAEGMEVITDDAQIDSIRKNNIRLILANHPDDCQTCSADGNCRLQDTAGYLGISSSDSNGLRRAVLEEKIDDSNPFFVRDKDKCILCGACVRACTEINGVHAIDYMGRGYDTTIATFANGPLADSTCESCGECMAHCPVGALSPIERRRPSRETATICTYCGCGCGMLVGTRGNEIISVRGHAANPASKGRLCVKGRFGFHFVNHEKRLKKPLIRKNGELVEASWDEALELVAEKFSSYRNSGRFAAISSAKTTNEENYVVQKFARAVMGTNNIDHCARLCHAPTVAGLKQSFGSGAMTNTINGFLDSKCMLAIGTNTTSAHPIIGYRIREAVNAGACLIVASPRKIDLVRHATLYLQHKPGTDVVLMMAMAKVIVDQELADSKFIKQRVDGYDEFVKSLDSFDLETAEKITGVSGAKIAEAARLFATLKPASILYAMGITQHTHGTDNVLATSNLALLTGNVGKPGSGVNPLRGQSNVQGACDVAALPNVYPGYQNVTMPGIRQKMQQAWDCTLDDKSGLTHLEIFDAIGTGDINCLYLVGENPVLSEADSNHVREVLPKLDFFVVQDIFLTETAQYADVVLPAASFAEKDGTVTNTERRIQRIRKVIDPVGDSRPDWIITSQIARKMGQKGFNFADPSAIMDEIASISPIYAGVSYDRLGVKGLQWPVKDKQSPGTEILHSEIFATATGRGNLKPLSYRPPAELPDDDYPLLLTTERSLYHFHTATMSRKSKGLEALRSEELVEINAHDAKKLGIADRQRVKVTSRRGTVEVTALITDVSPRGVVSMTFHFAESPTNVLTNSARDPVARIPETKVCAVKIEKT